MKRRWFKTWGWLYRPLGWQGFALALLGLMFSLKVFLAVDATSHSISDTLYGVFPYLVPSWILIYWVASKTAAEDE